MKLTLSFLMIAAGLSAQNAGPIVSTSKIFFSIAKSNVLQAADKIPAEMWNFRPTPDVRSFAEMFAHMADGQYEFCGPAKGETVDKGIEKNAMSKGDLLVALKDAFAYCDATLAGMTEASAVETVTMFGNRVTRIGILDFNTAHTMEHYGNLVTYMRLKGILPPSSEPRK